MDKYGVVPGEEEAPEESAKPIGERMTPERLAALNAELARRRQLKKSPLVGVGPSVTPSGKAR